MEIDTLRKSIDATCALTVDWFLDNSEEVTIDDWNNDELSDDELGAVFAFFDGDADCLYVGSTEESFKEAVERLGLENAKWWDNWDTIEILNIQDETDMKALEMLLIFGLEPEHCDNLVPRDPDEMFVQFEDL